MAYEALTGRRLFAQDNPAALARAIMDNPPPPAAAIRSDADPLLGAVIDRAMTRNPVQRFGSAAQMRAALAGDQAALFDVAAPVPVPSRPGTKVLPGPPIPADTCFAPPPHRPRRGKGRMYVSAAAVLVALVVSVVAMAKDSPPSTSPPQPVGTSTPAVPPPTVAPPPSPVVAPPGSPRPGEQGGRGHGKGDNKRG